jgi:NAD(P)H-dependent flavin oxidoreductase YrpB (nitropropane dioxygenase family)
LNRATPLTHLLGIRHPILLAPMGAVAGGKLAAAVTHAGGLGMIGPGYADSGWIEREFDAAEGERVGIGFISWDLAPDPKRLDAALARRPEAKQRVVHGTGERTVRTRVFDIARRIDWPPSFTGRALQNDFTRRWHGHESELGTRTDEFDRYAQAASNRDFDTVVVWAGEGVDLVKEVLPASRVVADLVTEAESAIARLTSLRSQAG